MDDRRQHIRESISEAAATAPKHGRGGTRPQTTGSIEQTFEADDDPPDGLMAVWELGEFRGELRFLRFPDTDEPFDYPWNAQVIGPNRNGRIEAVWSISKESREEAVDSMKRKLRQEHKRRGGRSDSHGHTHRRSRHPRPRTRGSYPANRFLPDDTYAVFDWQTKGFTRTGFSGQQVFESRAEAEELAEDDPQRVVVELVPVQRQAPEPEG